MKIWRVLPSSHCPDKQRAGQNDLLGNALAFTSSWRASLPWYWCFVVAAECGDMQDLWSSSFPRSSPLQGWTPPPSGDTCTVSIQLGAQTDKSVPFSAQLSSQHEQHWLFLCSSLSEWEIISGVYTHTQSTQVSCIPTCTCSVHFLAGLQATASLSC